MAIAVLRQAQIFRLGLRESASDAPYAARWLWDFGTWVEKQ